MYTLDFPRNLYLQLVSFRNSQWAKHSAAHFSQGQAQRCLSLTPTTNPMSTIPLEEALKEILKDNHVPDDICNWMQTVGCCTVKLFADWIEDSKEVEDGIIKASGTSSQDRRTRSSVIGAWKDAVSTNNRRLKRLSENSAEVSIDEPLGEMAQKAVDAAFGSRYNIDLPTYLRPSDSLLGKLKREFDRGLPTFIPLSKVKSAFMASRSQESKKHKASSELSIIIESEAEAKPSNRYRDVLLRLEVLANGWALAGCFIPPGQTAHYCTLQNSITYYRTLRDRTEVMLDSYPESAVVDYLISVEESFRGHALDAARRREDPQPWGKSLMDSLERFPVVWSDSAVVFSKAAGPSIPLISSVGQPPNQASMKGKLATKTHTKDNKVICKAYNDSRGCANPCRKGSVHCCDVELQKTKQACGQKHPRSQHDQQAHGAPAMRPNL